MPFLVGGTSLAFPYLLLAETTFFAAAQALVYWRWLAQKSSGRADSALPVEVLVFAGVGMTALAVSYPIFVLLRGGNPEPGFLFYLLFSQVIGVMHALRMFLRPAGRHDQT